MAELGAGLREETPLLRCLVDLDTARRHELIARAASIGCRSGTLKAHLADHLVPGEAAVSRAQAPACLTALLAPPPCVITADCRVPGSQPSGRSDASSTHSCSRRAGAPVETPCGCSTLFSFMNSQPPPADPVLSQFSQLPFQINLIDAVTV